jgi:hypothetical protein
MHSGAGPFAGQQSLAPSKNPSDSPILLCPIKNNLKSKVSILCYVHDLWMCSVWYILYFVLCTWSVYVYGQYGGWVGGGVGGVMGERRYEFIMYCLVGGGEGYVMNSKRTGPAPPSLPRYIHNPAPSTILPIHIHTSCWLWIHNIPLHTSPPPPHPYRTI